MTIKLQLPDAVYASLLKGNARVQGTIALVSPREGNFNVHSRKRNPSAREYNGQWYQDIVVGDILTAN